MNTAARWLAILAVFAAFQGVAAWSISLDLHRIEQNFQEERDSVERVISQRISALETVLVSITGLYHASDNVEIAELTGFTQELLRAYPFIEDIYHLQQLSEAERPGFEEAMREEGLISFRVHAAEDSSQATGSGPGRNYLAIDFIEPLHPLATGLLGLDLYTHPEFASAIGRAIDAGKIVTIGPTRLKKSLKSALYAIKPVFLGRYPPESVGERRAMLSGLVMLAVPESKLIRIDDSHPGYYFSLDQGVSDTPGPVAADSAVEPQLATKPLRLRAQLDLQLHGRYLPVAITREITAADVNMSRLLSSWLGILGVAIFIALAYRGRCNAQKHAEAARAEAAAEGERFSQVVDNAFDAVITSDRQGSIISWNRQATIMFGYGPEDAIGESVFPLILSEDALARYGDLLLPESRSDEQRISGRHIETEGCDRSGRTFPLELGLSVAKVNGETLLSLFARDITERMESDHQIRLLAYYDNLTQLPNRQLFKEHAALLLEAARRHGQSGALLFLDLDGFKRINDTLGHDFGDRLLVGVAQRLREQLRGSDAIARGLAQEEPGEETIARLGGDEFTLLLSEIRDPLSVAIVARRIQGAISKPFSLDGHEVYVTPSIGIALFPDDGDNVDEILKNADTAMYHAKALGKNNFQFYEETMNARAGGRLKLEGDLRKALERDEFSLAYQPQVEVSSGRIIGAEALLRWQHPELGNVPPFEFIPLAEETGMIIEIGEWVLLEACRQNREWIDAGIDPIRIAINLSPVQFAQGDLASMVEGVLNGTDLPAEYLELEITESVIMRNVDETVGTLQQFRDLGINLSVDDFGTGYSSLSYLKRLPIDTLKIDRSFVKDIPDSSDDMAITAAIIAMGHQLNLEIVAEGVETEAQLQFLQRHNCDFVQGYLFSKPIPAPELEQMLRSQGPSLGRKATA